MNNGKMVTVVRYAEMKQGNPYIMRKTTPSSFEQLAWERMERAYEGFLRALWQEGMGYYVET